MAEDDGVLTTFFRAQNDDGACDESYLLLQHQAKYDEQDHALGMNAPYIECGSQACGWYGNILSFRLLRDSVHIQMHQAAAKHIGNDGHITVTFTIDDQAFECLKSAVGVTFADQLYFVDAA